MEPFESVRRQLRARGFDVADADLDRPWGGFYVIDEDQIQNFIKTYFPAPMPTVTGPLLKLSPKILMVAPGQRLSWQYHYRRAELWSVVAGEPGIVLSPSDEQPEVTVLKPDDQIYIEKGVRHRLLGRYDWGIVAEIWKHTDSDSPSDELDIVRIEDDFRR